MEDVSIASRLEARIEEQQRAIDEIARRMTILDRVFEDLKHIEDDHEAHTLLSRIAIEEQEVEERDRRKDGCCSLC